MALIVRAFPVRDRAGVDSFAGEVQHRSDEAREFYLHFGVRREAWFYQSSDGQNFVIGVTDVCEPVEPRAAEYAAADDGFAAWFKARVYALSGVDSDTAPLGPMTEMVWDSSKGSLPMNGTLVVRAYPLRSRDALQEFIDELHAKPEKTRGLYERHGVEEAWFVQETERGPFAIAVLATEDPARVARTFQESADPFDVWFKQRVIEVSGVDPNRTPLGPPSEQVFDFRG
jgi:hypothetical protein